VHIQQHIIATSNLSNEHRLKFLAHEATDPVGVITGIGDVAISNLNGGQVFTCAQLLGKALLTAKPMVCEDGEQKMDVMAFYHEFVEPNVAPAYKKKIIHQIGDRFHEGVEIKYH